VRDILLEEFSAPELMLGRFHLLIVFFSGNLDNLKEAIEDLSDN
jgi:hypothetical protein